MDIADETRLFEAFVSGVCNPQTGVQERDIVGRDKSGAGGFEQCPQDLFGLGAPAHGGERVAFERQRLGVAFRELESSIEFGQCWVRS